MKFYNIRYRAYRNNRYGPWSLERTCFVTNKDYTVLLMLGNRVQLREIKGSKRIDRLWRERHRYQLPIEQIINPKFTYYDPNDSE